MNDSITNQAIRCHTIKPDVHMSPHGAGNCCVLMHLIPFRWCVGDMSCGRCPCQKFCGLCPRGLSVLPCFSDKTEPPPHWYKYDKCRSGATAGDYDAGSAVSAVSAASAYSDLGFASFSKTSKRKSDIGSAFNFFADAIKGSSSGSGGVRGHWGLRGLRGL